jgi:rhodanese-related sulfurtransferase
MSDHRSMLMYHGAIIGDMKKHSPRFLDLVNQVKSRIRETNVQAVKDKLDRGETFYLVDVREDNEWDIDHLPKAIHLSKGIIERDIETRIPDTGAEIVLYCGGGFRSALVADMLQKMGYANVISMDGGYTGWRNAGYPLAKG